MATKTFPLGVVLTVTTGRLLTKSKSQNDNGIGDLYDILGHMTGDSPFTHQLGRFAAECKPWLYRWFPEIEHQSNLVLPIGVELRAWLRHERILGQGFGCLKDFLTGHLLGLLQ